MGEILGSTVKDAVGPVEQREASDLLRLGRLEVFKNFQAGLQLATELKEGRTGSVFLLPSEALALATLIEDNREQLEQAALREQLLPGLDAISVSDSAASSDPIPAATVRQRVAPDSMSGATTTVPEYTTDT